MASQAFRDWVKAGRPNSGPIRPLKALRDRLRRYGYTVYDLGDQGHQEHVPPEDHTCFSATGWPVASQRWWLHALDIMPPKPGSGLPSLQQLGAQILADKKAGAFEPMKYMNWEPERDNGGPCYQERFMPDYVRRSSSDRGHIHLSGRSDMVNYAGADDYDPVARIRGNIQGDDMPLTDADAIKLWTWDLVDGPGVEPAYKMLVRAAANTETLKVAVAASAQREQDALSALAGVVEALKAGGGSVDAAAILARIDQRTADVTGTLAQLRAEIERLEQGIAERDAKIAAAYAGQ